MKRVLITGAHSYLGTSFMQWAKGHYPDDFSIEVLDLHDPEWHEKSFAGYDAVLHVAAIVHRVNEIPSASTQSEYDAVNTHLAVQVAEKAKREGVRQFVFLSSMGIYGAAKENDEMMVITVATRPSPTTPYGKSKWAAEQRIAPLGDEAFSVAILRPPMIYGKGCKGNYPTLSRIAKKLPIFPAIDNERSMLYIDNFSEFLCQLLRSGKGGLYFPQDAEYVNTSAMVAEIARTAGKEILLTSFLNPFISIAAMFPGSIGQKARKAFGSMVYDLEMSNYEGFSYHVVKFPETVALTETGET